MTERSDIITTKSIEAVLASLDYKTRVFSDVDRFHVVKGDGAHIIAYMGNCKEIYIPFQKEYVLLREIINEAKISIGRYENIHNPMLGGLENDNFISKNFFLFKSAIKEVLKNAYLK